MCHFLAPAGQQEMLHKNFMRLCSAYFRGAEPARQRMKLYVVHVYLLTGSLVSAEKS